MDMMVPVTQEDEGWVNNPGLCVIRDHHVPDFLPDRSCIAREFRMSGMTRSQNVFFPGETNGY